MKFALIENGIVKQIQPNAQVGFIEVPDTVVCGQVDNGDGTFSNPQLTQAELDAQTLAAKWADINSQIANLKIGYLDGNTFVAKFGYEIDGYTTDDTNLYDVSNLPIAQVSVSAHVYNASAEGLRAMTEQAAILAPDITINWYEDWQTFAADKVCLDVVAARAREEHQLIRDTVMGV